MNLEREVKREGKEKVKKRERERLKRSSSAFVHKREIDLVQWMQIGVPYSRSIEPNHATGESQIWPAL
jgi:hypothetical protein